MVGDPAGRCADRGTCYQSWFVDGAFDAYTTCMEEMACDANDDVCVGTVLMSVAPTPEGSAYAATCAAREAECGSFSADGGMCDERLGSAIRSDLRVALEACLALPCAEVQMCLWDAEPC